MTQPSTPELVLVEDRTDYALVQINRPEKRNAVNRETRRQMLAAFDRLRGVHKVIVLTGSQTSFCAGVDLKEAVADREAGMGEDPRSDWPEVNLAIRQHPAIFIAAVNGFALGGGSTLINVCDLAIAADEAEIGMPEIGFATYPGLAGPAMQMTLNRKRAAWMILTAERASGKQAAEWGIVNQSVPAAELLTAADELARRIAKFDAAALAACKRALDVIPGSITDWRQAFDFGAKVNAHIRSVSSAQRSGMANFAEGKRNPGQGGSS